MLCRDGEASSRDPCALGFAPPWAGWARDRMWAQYADGHRGVCLAFDRSNLVDAFNTAFPARGDRMARDVTYSDDARSLSFDNDRLREVGVQQYAAEYRRQHAEARYLTKRLDWAGEQEFRLVLLDDDPTAPDARVRIHGALAYIMMGDRFPAGYLPCIDAIMRQRGIPAYRLRYDGEVYALKYS